MAPNPASKRPSESLPEGLSRLNGLKGEASFRLNRRRPPGTIATSLSVLTVMVFILILWGGVVRNAGAGLACPDWPLCHGQLIPPLEGLVLLEYSHRLLAAAVGFLTLGCALAIWGRPGLRSRLGGGAVMAVLALAVQVVLGGLAVKGLLSPSLVAAHLALALGFFALILEMTLRAHGSGRELGRGRPQRSGLWVASCGSTALVYLQAALGGLVSSYHAGLACPDLPTCNGLWLPPFEGPVGLHMAHRIGAALVTLAVVGLVAGGKTILLTDRQHLLLRADLSLLVLQLLLGIANVLLELSPWIDVAHLGAAVALFAVLWATTREIAYRNRIRPSP